MRTDKSKSRSWVRLAAVLVIVFAAIGFGTSADVANRIDDAAEAEQFLLGKAEEVIEGVETAAQESTTWTPEFLASPPEMTKEQIAERERIMQEIHPQEAEMPAEDVKIVGPSGGETTVGGDAPQVPGTFRVWSNRSLTPSGGSIGVSDINEPAVANSGRYVFYTGNWYAARSTRSGNTWTYVDPYAGMPTFCCDQDVIYDKSRNIFIWYRQSSKNAVGVNFFKICVSINSGKTWTCWNWYPTSFNSTWTNQWWDYPHLALSNDYLYFTSNMFPNTGSMTRSVLARASLDALRAGGSLSWTYWTQTTQRTWTPVQGARETMYVGQTATSTQFKVWRQQEANTTLTLYTRTVPAWTTGKGTCTLPNGNNPCARSDNRVRGGWVANGVIGFFWNAKQGGGFPYPYVNAATFYESTINYKNRPYIWSSNFAWHYAYASPNARGDLGIATWLMGNGRYPKFYVGIDDDYNGAPPGWEVKFIVSSTTGPGSNTWGDYLRVRAHEPAALGWIASGYRSITGGVSQPRLAIFSRERDERSVKRWWAK